eukprot:scaffold67722_cov34-Phaeocystis_antarctica.AAC.1
MHAHLGSQSLETPPLVGYRRPRPSRERLWLATARESSGALPAAPRRSLGGPQRVVPERRANPHRNLACCVPRSQDGDVTGCQ